MYDFLWLTKDELEESKLQMIIIREDVFGLKLWSANVVTLKEKMEVKIN